MLPAQHKLTSSPDFRRTVKAGRRGGSKTLVVHVYDRHTEPVLIGGPRFGLIVSKAVGNAVIRHRVSRRLRHLLHGNVDKIPAYCDVVVRALPAAAGASFDELGRDLARAWRKTQRG